MAYYVLPVAPLVGTRHILTNRTRSAQAIICTILYMQINQSNLYGCRFFINAGPHFNMNNKYIARIPNMENGLAMKSLSRVRGSEKIF